MTIIMVFLISRNWLNKFQVSWDWKSLIAGKLIKDQSITLNLNNNNNKKILTDPNNNTVRTCVKEIAKPLYLF